jgi:hypothetical protein
MDGGVPVAPIFALWGRILRTRADVYVQLLLTVVGAALVAALVGIDVAIHGGQNAGAMVLLALVLFAAVLSFGYGAALGALGEAARGDAATAFWQRGYRLWGRTLGLFAVELLIVIVLLIVIIVVLGAAGLLTGIGQIASVGTAQATAEVYRLASVFIIAAIILAFGVGPWLQAAQAIIYIDQQPVLVGFSLAFAAGYARGRLGHWLLMLLIAIALDLVAGVVETALGTTGQVLGILLSPAVLWLATALAFATYRVHEAGSPPAEVMA